MLGVHVTVPVACFRKGLAREYLETEPLPPPATCYGFLLSLVGETDRRKHIGCRVAPSLLCKTRTSVVLRTVWRVKKTPLGSPGNTRPDYQQLLTGAEEKQPFLRLLIWLDHGDEPPESSLETRVRRAFATRFADVTRFGGLCLGESTHLVDEVNLAEGEKASLAMKQATAFLKHERGRLTLPVWVDHVGSARTRFETGNLESITGPPAADLLSRIAPH